MQRAEHVVLVVHGVGEQRPGETVAQVATGALNHIDPSGSTAVVHQSDVIHLPEPYPRKPHLPLRRNFPAHRVTLKTGATSDGPARKTTLVEVHWADLSPAPTGALRTILDFAKVLLGIGYIALINAEDTGGRWPRLLVRLFLAIFFALIAPLGLFFLIFGAITFPEGGVFVIFEKRDNLGIVPARPIVVAAIATGATLAIGAFKLVFARPQTLAVRTFCIGVVLVGFGAATSMIWTGITAEAVDNRKLAVEWLRLFLTKMEAALSWSWAAALLILMLLMVVSFITRPSGERPGDHRIFPAVLSGMSILWMTLVAALWFALFYRAAGFALQIDGTNKLCQARAVQPINLFTQLTACGMPELTRTLLPTSWGLGIFIALALGLAVLRWLWFDRIHEGADVLRRLFFNRLAQAVLVLTSVSATIWGLLSVSVHGGNVALHAIPAWLPIVLLVLGFVLFVFVDSLSLGLGVVRDVIGFVTVGHLGKGYRRTSYPIRDAIEHRFERVLDHVLTTYRPARLTIIAHSLGTVVATQCLQRANATAGLQRAGRVELITAGSPITHIFTRYFPGEFAVTGDIPGVDRWTNYYRSADYVGTMVEVLPESANIYVGPGSHGGYFDDPAFWQSLSTARAFALF